VKNISFFFTITFLFSSCSYITYHRKWTYECYCIDGGKKRGEFHLDYKKKNELLSIDSSYQKGTLLLFSYYISGGEPEWGATFVLNLDDLNKRQLVKINGICKVEIIQNAFKAIDPTVLENHLGKLKGKYVDRSCSDMDSYNGSFFVLKDGELVTYLFTEGDDNYNFTDQCLKEEAEAIKYIYRAVFGRKVKIIENKPNKT
jgi:hypothetical protein